jgi:hypothetical protein
MICYLQGRTGDGRPSTSTANKRDILTLETSYYSRRLKINM